MLSRSLGTVALVILLAATTLSSVAIAQQPTGSSSPTPTASPTRTGGLTPNTFSVAESGFGSYVAGSNLDGTSLILPLVRTDTTYDTIIHIANASGTATTVTITLYLRDGTPSTPYTSSLRGWGSLDYDVQNGQGVPANFQGSAAVTSTASPIVVTGEVLNSADTADNVDSYSEVPSSSTSQSGNTNTTYLPLLPSCTQGAASCSSTVSPTLYLRNNDPRNPANANLTFYWTNPPSPGPSPTPVATTVPPIPANGEQYVAVNSVNGIAGFNFDAATQIQSDKPLAVAADENASGFWAAAPTPSNQGSTFYVPKFVYQLQTDSNSFTTGLVLLNVAPTKQTFTVYVYSQTGQLALIKSIPDILPMGVGKFNYGGVNQDLSLPDGFTGSLVITSEQSAVTWFAKYKNSNFAASIYFTPTTLPPSGTIAVVPAIRKQVTASTGGVASTAISIQNPSNSTETYTISFRDTVGTLVYSENVTFPPHAMWYLSQETDPKLPSQFSGSAQIANASGGRPPIVAADVDAGGYHPAPTLPFPNQVFLPLVSRGD